MKSQIRKPSSGKAHFSVEDKREELEYRRSVARVAEELGIRAPLLYRWG
jgi:hypothetical protein